MKIWSLLRGETRDGPEIGINEWSQYFNYNPNANYVLGFGPGYGENGKSETVENSFTGYINETYKSNGVVFACSMARMLVFSEVRFAYQKTDRARPGDLEPIPGVDLLEAPWPNGTTGEMLARAIQDVDMAGNHYMVREDKPGGKPRLRRLRPDWVHIVLSADPKVSAKSDIVAYVYKPGNTDDAKKWEIFPVDGSNGAVAHWSPIPDPDAQYRGMSWITPVLPEILGDKAISHHKLKFFKNGATPNLAVAMDPSVTPERFKEFKDIMDSTHGGAENAYKTLYLGGGADVHVVGANIQQMDFKVVTGIGETRIAAAARVHPVIVGLSEGLQGSSLSMGNFESARNAFASGTMRPLWRSLCAAYSVLVDVPEGSRLWYDDNEVQFLREDRTKVAERQQIQATTISRYVMQGYTPESSMAAVVNDDIMLLKHTGLFSVQLLPPEISKPELAAAKAGTQAAQDGKKPADGKSGSKANNNPTGSKRKPVGRPPAESKDAWQDALERGEDWSDSVDDDV